MKSGGPYVADHDYISITYKLEGAPTIGVCRYRSFKSLKLPSFQRDLKEFAGEELSSLRLSSDINLSYNRFATGLIQILDKHVPYVEYRCKGRPCRYITAELKELFRKRDLLYRKYKQTKRRTYI